jgi:hypothetical protein
MALIIIVGVMRSPGKAPEAVNLYTGYDADAGFKLSEAAADSGDFSELTRFTSPSGSKLRIQPHSTVFQQQKNAAAGAVKKAASDQTAASLGAAVKKKADAEAAAKLQKDNQAAADALQKEKNATNQIAADEFVSGRKAGKTTKAAQAPKPDEETAK